MAVDGTSAPLGSAHSEAGSRDADENIVGPILLDRAADHDELPTGVRGKQAAIPKHGYNSIGVNSPNVSTKSTRGQIHRENSTI
jgi:hypothetical protein